MVQKIKELCKYRGISISKLEKQAGLGNGTIGKWEKFNRRPKYESLKSIADVLEVSVSALLGEEKTPTLEGERPQGKAIKIPVLGSVPAGIPIEAVEEILDWEEIPASMCRGGKEYFALLVDGDSMWPDYLPGDVVIVRKTPDCDTGDDCIVYVNGYDATLKQVKKGADGSISIIPRNRSYPPKTYSADEIRTLPVSIAGVVVELRRKIGRK